MRTALLGLALVIASALPAFGQMQLLEGGSTQDGGRPVTHAVSYLEQVHAGGQVAVTQVIYGSSGAGRSSRFYVSGVDGRTLHLYRVELDGIAQQERETSRLPILLPMGSDESAVLVFDSLFKSTRISLRIKRLPDGSFGVTASK